MHPFCVFGRWQFGIFARDSLSEAFCDFLQCVEEARPQLSTHFALRHLEFSFLPLAVTQLTLCSRVFLEHLILVQLLQSFLSFYHIHKSLHLATGLNHFNPVTIQTPHSFRNHFSITIPACLGLTNKIDLFIAQVSLPEFFCMSCP